MNLQKLSSSDGIKAILAVLGNTENTNKPALAPARHSWTPEAVHRLLTLKQQGFTYSEIARKMGTTKGAIRNKLYRLRTNETQKASNADENAVIKVTLSCKNGILTVNDITISRKEV